MFVTLILLILRIFSKKKKKNPPYLSSTLASMELSSFPQPIFFQMVCDLISYQYLQDLADGSGPDSCIYNFLNSPEFGYSFSAYSGQDFRCLGVAGIPVIKNKSPCSRSPRCICSFSTGCSRCSLKGPSALSAFLGLVYLSGEIVLAMV